MFLKPLISFDQHISLFFQEHQSFFAHTIFSLLTFLGEWWFLLGISIILIIVFSRKQKFIYILALIVGTLGVEATTLLLKLLVSRARPPYHSYTPFEQYASFPSGHAALAVTFYGFILFLLLQHEQSRPKRLLYALGGVSFIIMIGLSRVLLGMHYPSDIIAGFFIGAIFLILSISITQGKIKYTLTKFFATEKNNRKRKPSARKTKTRTK